jgi:hypothetical protein
MNRKKAGEDGAMGNKELKKALEHSCCKPNPSIKAVQDVTEARLLERTHAEELPPLPPSLLPSAAARCLGHALLHFLIFCLLLK